MNLFKLFNNTDKSLQDYRNLEKKIVDIKNLALTEFDYFSKFQSDCNQRLSNISHQLEKSKDVELIETRNLIQGKYKLIWKKYLENLSNLRQGLKKAQDEQISLLKNKEVRSYILFKQDENVEIKKAIDIVISGYESGEIERREFNKVFSRTLSMDLQTPGLVEYFHSKIKKAKVELFQDYLDVLDEVFDKREVKEKYADCIIFNDKDEILFLRRRPDSEFAPYEYGLPGGHIDLGEEPRETAKRELSEECSITAEHCDFKLKYEDDKCIIHYFQCTVKEPYEVVLTRDEHFNYEWLSHEKRRECSLIPGLNDNLDKIYQTSKELDIKSESLKRVFSEEEISEKYEITVEEVRRLLDEGTEIELEHTEDREVARGIASQHIYNESIHYYPELRKVEENVKDN